MYQVVKSPTFLSVDEDLWEWELFPTMGWDGEMAQLFWRTIWQYPMKLEIGTTEPFHSRLHLKQSFSVYWGKWLPGVAEIGTHSALGQLRPGGLSQLLQLYKAYRNIISKYARTQKMLRKHCPSKTPQACQTRGPLWHACSTHLYNTCTWVLTASWVAGRGNYLNVHQQKKQ